MEASRGHQRASHFPVLQPRHGTAGILPAPQDSVHSRCQMLGNPSRSVCAHVCCQVLKPEEVREGSFWEGNPQFTPVSSLPTSGRVCRGPWLQDTVADRWIAGIGLFCGPQLHSPSGEWVCVMVQGGEAALCSEWLLGEHTVPPRTLRE